MTGNIPLSPQQQPVRHLGVDDSAWRKYQSFGTILVDLEQHCVADLLPDRSAETLSLCEFPERKPPSGRRQKVAAFGDHLQQRWNEGCHNATLLTQEIRSRGYKGSRQMVGYFVSKWRKTGHPPAKSITPERVAPKHAAILACSRS